jgi:hypothetical protein
MNILPVASVLPDMSIHGQHGKHGAPAGDDHVTDTPGQRRRCWRPRRRRNRGAARRAPEVGTDRVPTAAGAMQLAIGLLTASLDSPELEAWAAWTLIPEDPAALGDFIAGLHVVSQLLLHELQEATGQSSATTLQRLAILAETGRGTPSPG